MTRALPRRVEAGARESDARPLVRVYLSRQVRRAWRNRVLDGRLLDRTERIAGWYVVSIAVKALQPSTDASGLAGDWASESEVVTAAYGTRSTAS